MNGSERIAAGVSQQDVDGIVLLDKPEGISSNAALQRVRRAFRARKAGHTGSLDPLASGLLPICLGQATKACALLLDADKAYRFRLALGRRTSTGDREGETIATAPVMPLDEAVIRRRSSAFLGESMQVPPMYSALKHAGQRLYRLARAGVEVERAPRRVLIERLELLAAGEDWLDFEVACSKGTYVRSLAEDLARAFGTVGHVASLRRIGLGPFNGMPMHTLDRIEEAASGGVWPRNDAACGGRGSAGTARRPARRRRTGLGPAGPSRPGSGTRSFPSADLRCWRPLSGRRAHECRRRASVAREDHGQSAGEAGFACLRGPRPAGTMRALLRG